MEEAIKFEAEDAGGTITVVELVLDGDRETAEIRMKNGKKVFSVEWGTLREVMERALRMWKSEDVLEE
jgi:hypothetical protein